VIRRMQLLAPEDRLPAPLLAGVGKRIRDGLLRDNKVVPVVLATLALLIFAWLVAGAFIGVEPNEEAANQASLAQDEELENGNTESPAPGVENRDTDSYSAFESKDPFRQLLSKAGGAKAGDSKTGDSRAGGTKTGGTKTGGTKTGGTKTGSNGGARGGAIRDDEDSTDRSSPGGSRSRGGLGGAAQDGSGDLFSSGGDLPAP
jgi:hypothetical protein